MIRYTFLLLVLISLYSCNDSDHFGYDRLEGSIHYRLLSLGEENLKVETADHLSLRIEFIGHDESKFTKDFKRINWKESKFPSYFYELFKDASHGDSISLIGSSIELQVNSIFGSDIVQEGEEDVEIQIHIYEAFNDAKLREVMALERLKLDKEIKEQSTLNRVLDSLQIANEDMIDGIYFKSISESEGKLPVKGDFISVNYSARLGNGKLVDDNYDNEGLAYQVGKPDQVIPGFSIGIGYLSEGSEAYFVIPSKLGFGEKGSSSGIIPGYSVLVYRVSLTEIAD